jgi:hypothetical protein
VQRNARILSTYNTPEDRRVEALRPETKAFEAKERPKPMAYKSMANLRHRPCTHLSYIVYEQRVALYFECTHTIRSQTSTGCPKTWNRGKPETFKSRTQANTEALNSFFQARSRFRDASRPLRETTSMIQRQGKQFRMIATLVQLMTGHFEIFVISSDPTLITLEFQANIGNKINVYAYNQLLKENY